MPKKSKANEMRSRLAEALDTNNQTAAATTTLPAMTTTDAPVTADASIEPATVASAAKTAEKSADQIVTTSMLLAAGAGAVPLPVWDSALLFGVQLKMLSDLSTVYNKPFSENLGKSALAAVLGCAGPGLIARSAIGSAIKGLPGIGSVLGALTQPALAAAITYAVGKVFIKHYESGGTLLSFNAAEFKDNFSAEVKAGLKKAYEFKY